MAGCAGLPQHVERPVSTSLPPSDGSALQKILSGLGGPAKEARRGNTSAFLLLDSPQDAFTSRLALIQQAQKTLDLQYYAIHADASSERLLRGIVAAARRGVRVRILLDDFHSTGRNALVMRMAFEPRIEMRMFNPVAGSRASPIGRLWSSLTDFSRVQQRMHNKLFLADNVMGVTGGRNLGDAYFGFSDAANFVDMDVLAAGPIVQDMSRSFDSYWNNERAYPVQSLITREELDRLRTQVLQDDGSNDHSGDEDVTGDAAAPARSGATQAARNVSGNGSVADSSSNERAGSSRPMPPDGEPRPAAGGPTQEQRERVWRARPMDLARAGFVWAPAVLMADKPTKIPLDDPAASASSDAPGQSPAAPGSTPEGPEPKTGTIPITSDGDTVVDGVLKLIGLTRSDLLIISPYFVPGDDMKAAFAKARARGVRVRILTNSLASNDAPIAHVGYARHRQELLDMGIELYEMRSDAAGLRSAFGSSAGAAGGEPAQDSRAMLHSKVMVIDGRLLVIGSMNLDLRSQLQNTEIALLIRSAELSGQAAAQIESAMRYNAWRLERDAQGGLRWIAPEGSGLPDATTDPNTSLGLRLILKLLGPLAPDQLL
ncbi:PLD-like domain-containing protein [Paracidovorax wautersii]|uniref:PLD-like domain-containing protein n=2 Tax=Paracidovorax wautersii TaxID=1177982 RepID=A0A1I2CPE9_9BURK|nr:phospholipase D family protein [Paracidovorax wautersii]SFE69673.1 PLD-like domain-containing protein [Paracidovorax wautersii]